MRLVLSTVAKEGEGQRPDGHRGGREKGRRTERLEELGIFAVVKGARELLEMRLRREDLADLGRVDDLSESQA